MNLLEGTKRRSVLLLEEEEEKSDRGENEEDMQEITREDLIRQLKRLKRGKAPGEDGIVNEAWRYMAKEIGEGLWKLINNIWKKGGIPEDWNKGIINPIYKRGEKSEINNYRGITLMDTAYKIYVSILNEKLMGEVDNKLQETQFGFRAGRGAIDEIYVLNYAINKELSRKEGKIFAFFADLKTAFDKIDRRELNEIIKRRGIEEQLRRRVMETYRETINTVKIGDRETEKFWTERGVRQECPMSPVLFNMYVMDLEEEMRKEQTGGVIIGKEKF